jgi:hypothetical protein
VVKNNARYYLHLLTGQKEFVVGFLIVLLAWPSLLAIRWYLLFPALWGFFLYGLIHVEPRLVGVFFVIFWMPLFASLRVRSRSVVLLVTLLVVFATAFKVTKAQISAPRHATNMQWQTAAGLNAQALLLSRGWLFLVMEMKATTGLTWTD